MEEETHDIQERIERLKSYVPPEGTQRLHMVYALVLLFSLAGLGTVLALSVYAGENGDEASMPVLPENPFDTVSLESKSVVVWDMKGEQILYGKQATTTHALASVTKLMTAYTAEKHAPTILSIPVTAKDLLLEGDQGLLPGETWRLRDLLDYSLVTSSNDGMSAVAAAIGALSYGEREHAVNKTEFVELMNETARELKLTSMAFHNESGLDNEMTGIAGGYGSAYDVGRLLGALLSEFPDSLSRTREQSITLHSLSGFTHTGPNTNLSTSKIPGLLASKTGFTDLAGGNLAIVFNAGLNRPIAIVVLGSSIEGRFSDTEKLVEKTNLYIREYEPILKQIESGQAEKSIVK